MAIVSASMDLSDVLREQRPMGGSSSGVDGEEQDGFSHHEDRCAPLARDFAGAAADGRRCRADGCRGTPFKICGGLTSVTQTSEFPVAGQLVAFPVRRRAPSGMFTARGRFDGSRRGKPTPHASGSRDWKWLNLLGPRRCGHPSDADRFESRIHLRLGFSGDVKIDDHAAIDGMEDA